jgi:hypothetical protein
MKFKLSYFLFLLVLLVSCKDDNQKGMLTMRKTPKGSHFSNITKDGFYDTPINETAEAKTTLDRTAFVYSSWLKKKKPLVLSSKSRLLFLKKAMALKTNIPVQFNVPQNKSRISVLITKVRMLDLYIHLDKIPDDKVVVSIAEINKELASLQREMDKIVEKSKIPVEEGESELIK